MAHRNNQPPDAERIGNTRMITLITPIVPFGTWWLRALFRLTRPFPQLLGIGPMKVVHFTYWSLLTTIPYNGAPQLRERLRRPLLIWGSVFNGEVDPYVEAFVVAVAPQIRLTWGTSYGFPGVGSVSDLREYIVAASWPGSYAYSAYPEATVRTIASAMAIKKEHAFLCELARRATPEEFAIAYDGFLRRCQEDL